MSFLPRERPSRVLVLPSWYPTERYPMGGIFCQEQARALNTSEAVDVVVLYVDRAPVLQWLRSLRRRSRFGNEAGLRVYRTAIPRLPLIWPLPYVLWALFSAWRLSRLGFKPDIVHAHVALPAGLAGVLMKRLLGVRLVVTEHTGPFSMLMRNRFAAFATRFALQSADRVVVVSKSLRDQIWAYPQLRRLINIVPNVVDTRAFSIPRAPRAEAASTRLLFIGEMDTSIKGVDYLLGAVALLRRRGVELQLDLVGRGRNRTEYEALARRLGVDDVCRFLGVVPHEEVARLMSKADLFVLPSLAETFGVVLVEALSSGLPVVATRAGGPEEIVTPDVGVLVESADSAALAEGIFDVISRLDEFPAEHLREVAEGRYGQASVAGRLVTLYKQVRQ
jgi:L-malate glycosyltransferase